MFLRSGALAPCLTLAACGGDPGSGSDDGKLLTGDKVNPAAAKRLVSDFAKLKAPAQEKQVADLNSSVERAAWKRSAALRPRTF